MTRISVISVNYNNRDGLARTMDSVASQQRVGFDLEYLVIDGGSKDGSVELMQARRREIDVLISEPDGGIYDAMNKGLRHATGDWVNFMNSGDCFADEFALKRIAEAVREKPECRLVYGDNITVRGHESADVVDVLKAGIIHACHQAMAFWICDLRYDERWPIYADLDFVLQYYLRFSKQAFYYLGVTLSSTEESGMSAAHPHRKRLEKFGILLTRLGPLATLRALGSAVLRKFL